MASPAGGGQADVVYPQFFADHMRISTLCAEGVALLEAHPEAAPAYWTQLLHFGLKLGQFLSLGVPPRIFVFSHPLSGSGFPFRSLTGSFFFEKGMVHAEQRHKMSRTMYGAGDMSVELLDHMLSLQRSLSETKV